MTISRKPSRGPVVEKHCCTAHTHFDIFILRHALTTTSRVRKDRIRQKEELNNTYLWQVVLGGT